MKHESEKQQKSIKEIIVLKKQFASTHLTVVVFVFFFFNVYFLNIIRLSLRCCSQWIEEDDKKFYNLVIISYTVKTLSSQCNFAFIQVTW